MQTARPVGGKPPYLQDANGSRSAWDKPPASRQGKSSEDPLPADHSVGRGLATTLAYLIAQPTFAMRVRFQDCLHVQ